MRTIRKLYFQNAAGDRYGLNGEKGVYASGISGLGFTLSLSYADLGSGFFIPVTNEIEPQSALPFTLTFTRNPYQSYKSLVDWLMAAGSITVVYSPTGTQEYYRAVTVNFMQKGELNAVGWLEVPCSFLFNTWYLPSPTSLNMEASGVDESKRYDYAYSNELRYGSDCSASMSCTIAGSGHIPGALDLEYHGAIVNPRIRLTGNVSSKTYGVCSVAVTLGASDTLKISTRYENSYVKRISADGSEVDLLDALDLVTTPFFHIPVDEPCTVSIEADAAFAGTADLLIYYYFRSV